MTIVADRVGPVYSREQIVEAGLDPSTLVSFMLRGGDAVYPASQFDVAEGRLHLRPEVARLWHDVVDAGLDRLGGWLWMTEPRQAFDGFSPLHHLTRRGWDASLTAEVRRLIPAVTAA